MNWKLKATALSLLSRVPSGRRIYHALQKVAGTTCLNITNDYTCKAVFLKRTFAAGLEIEGKDVLEIGTGWHPVLPLLLRLLGARRVLSLDVNPWLTWSSLQETVDGLKSVLPSVSEDFGIPEGELRARFTQIVESGLTRQKSLRASLMDIGIEYLQPFDARHTGLPPACVDVVVSFNVFEHLPPDTIRDLLAESRHYLRPGGWHVHRINPGDHFAGGRVSTINFLRYSPRAWHLISSGLAYHNRLRSPEYLRLLQEANMCVRFSETQVDARAIKTLGDGFPIDSNFAGYTTEELATDTLLVGASVSG